MRARIRSCLVLVALLVPVTAGTAEAHEPWVTEYSTTMTEMGVWDLTTGKDGNLWFTQEYMNTFGRVTTLGSFTDFPLVLLSGTPRGVTTGPDGNLWMALSGLNGSIARVTTAGALTEFDTGVTGGDLWDITVGPDGNLWYVNRDPAIIGRITPDGVVTEFTAGLTAGSEPSAITAGPDGNLWFTETETGRIGRITTAGAITEFTSGLSGSDAPTDITAGPDGALWFTLNADPGGIGRISKTGDVTIFEDGLTPNSRPVGITEGPDGALWFTESASPGRIGRITTSGHVTEYTGGLTAGLSPWFIAPGPDGNIWFTQNALLGGVARITLPPVVKAVAADELDLTTARLRAKVGAASQATELYFEYGPTSAYGAATGTISAGSGAVLQHVNAGVTGLAPATEYHFRAVATNNSGITFGPDRVFETLPVPLPVSDPDPGSEPAPEEKPGNGVQKDKDPEAKASAKPEFAETVVAEPEGSVRVKEPGGEWVDLARGNRLPVGARFDARRGAVTVTTVDCRGETQTGTFGAGVFALGQPRHACGRVDLYLRGGRFGSCPRDARPGAHGLASASRSRRVRRLWGRDRGGRFRTHGRHSQATVRGTRWLTVDRCDGTLTRVTEGAVVVRDFARDRRILVRAGRSYLAKRRR